MTELVLLRRLGYLRVHSNRYSLAADVEQEFIDSGATVVDLVPPRQYNAMTAPPLCVSRLHNPAMRRPNCLSVEITRHFTASNPVPFHDDYDPEPRTQIPQPEDDAPEL